VNAAVTDICNFIGNRFVPAQGNGWMDVVEPATGAPYARLATSGPADIEAAVHAARAAFPAWSVLPPEHRAAYLNALADLLQENVGVLASAESRDTGKPISVARNVDIPRAISNFRFFAAAASQFASESHAMADHAINYTLRQPLGVVGCISPWNLPLYLLTWKLAPALACGNTVVAKPSEVTPYTAMLLCELCETAGLPKGVLNVVHGLGLEAGDALVRHPALSAVSFTGSTATGKSIAIATADQFKKLSLEMGGKNPTLVFADCDFERTASEVARSAFSNQGQICLCGSRILVEAGIYDQFRDALLHQCAQIQSGDPSLPATRHGAIISEAHYQKVTGYLDLAKNEGGRILCGGPRQLDGRCAQGRFIDPVLIEGLDQGCRTNQEEIFGPVATLQAFTSESEALALANASSYGLACSIWSRDLSRCHRLASRIQCGIVWINCWMQRDLRTPFGGMKSSGLGLEGGFEAMRFFTQARNVCIEYGDE
jgi:aminomuconate-semialdehyde/2-hydroxymuconate-6-semialdehyde dehydrogenase